MIRTRFFTFGTTRLQLHDGHWLCAGRKRQRGFQKYWCNKPRESEIVPHAGQGYPAISRRVLAGVYHGRLPHQPEMLPTTIFAHGWIYYEQDKMSKSKGNVVSPEPIVDALDSLGAPGNDALRYYLLREAPFGQDTSFSYEGFHPALHADGKRFGQPGESDREYDQPLPGKRADSPTPVAWEIIHAAIKGEGESQAILAANRFALTTEQFKSSKNPATLHAAVYGTVHGYNLSLRWLTRGPSSVKLISILWRTPLDACRPGPAG